MTPQTEMKSAGSGNAYKPLSTVFGLNKRELDAIEVLGFELYQQGRAQEAAVIFTGLIALDQRMYRGYAGMGTLALADQRLDEAANWLEQALERNTDDPTVHANLGETLLKLGRYDRAAAEFEKALALDPQEKDPGANRARAILTGMKAMIAESRKDSSEEQLSRLDSDN